MSSVYACVTVGKGTTQPVSPTLFACCAWTVEFGEVETHVGILLLVSLSSVQFGLLLLELVV